MPKTDKKQKPTKAEINRRIDIIESLVIDCASVTDIQRYFKEKEGLPVSRRTVERYRDTAEKRILTIAQPKREREIKVAKARLERCFARAISGSKKNVFAAISAQKAINNLLGLNAVRETENDMTPEEFARLVVLEQKAMKRVTLGPAGLEQEVIDLFSSWADFGNDPKKLLNTIASRIKEGAINE